MEELKRFEGSTFDEFSRRRLIEDPDTILDLAAKIQELQNEVNCRNDSRDFKDAESVPVYNPTLPVNLTHGMSGNDAPYPQELHQWVPEPISSTVEKSVRQTQDQDQRCQSEPSARNSVIFSGKDSSKNNGADQQRLQISDLHFDKFPTPATFACWKIRFKTEACTCSQFPTEAM